MAPFNVKNEASFNVLNNNSVEKNEEYKDICLSYNEIIITKHNKYSMVELEEMANSFLLDGIQEPLILGRINGEYWLASGHRRIAAVSLLIKAGHEEFGENIPCRYKDMTETQFRIALLVGNTYNRKMTDYDLMNQATDWKEVLTQARKEKLLILESGERVRDYVAKVLGESSAKIGQLEAINNNATLEIKEQFEKGNLGITSAYEASKLEEEDQVEVAEAVERGQDVKSEEIKAIAEEGKKRKSKEEIAKEQCVSDTDTTEEEKENAKKLHALKMIEKYYIYLNSDEVRILEAMLEDCKRRKIEYAIEEN